MTSLININPMPYQRLNPYPYDVWIRYSDHWFQTGVLQTHTKCSTCVATHRFQTEVLQALNVQLVPQHTGFKQGYCRLIINVALVQQHTGFKQGCYRLMQQHTGCKLIDTEPGGRCGRAMAHWHLLTWLPCIQIPFEAGIFSLTQSLRLTQLLNGYQGMFGEVKVDGVIMTTSPSVSVKQYGLAPYNHYVLRREWRSVAYF